MYRFGNKITSIFVKGEEGLDEIPQNMSIFQKTSAKVISMETLEKIYKDTFKSISYCFHLCGINMTCSTTTGDESFPCFPFIITAPIFIIFLLINVIWTALLMWDIFFEERESDGFHANLPEVFINCCAIILLALLLLKRKELGNISAKIWEHIPHYRSYYNLEDFKNFRRKTEVTAAIVFGFHFASAAHSIHMHMNRVNNGTIILPSKIKMLEQDNPAAFDVVVIANLVASDFMFTTFGLYVIYHGLVCSFLRVVIEQYRRLLSRESDCDNLINLHTTLITTVNQADEGLCKQAFWWCSACLSAVFYHSFQLINKKANVGKSLQMHYICFIVYTIIFYAMMIYTGASVAESADYLKEYVHHINLDTQLSKMRHFVLGIRISNYHITIWKMISMRRGTVLSVLGALFTYGVVLA